MTNVRMEPAVAEPIDSLTVHPRNARRGNIKLIAESLAAHGQYRPIVAQTSTRHILAGNHTWQAAKSLGWTSIAVTWLDVDDAEAAAVLIADNRTSDLATYDDAALATLLRSLPSLDGTGFDRYDLDKLDGVFSDQTASGGDTKPKPDIALGDHILWVDPAPFAEWETANAQESKAATSRHYQTLLNLPAKPKPTRPPRTKAPTNVRVSTEIVDINSLEPFDGNARQGDIGAICESLARFGQYRPIVVNRPDRRILVGNHTHRAARHLGWTHIAVTWVDVNPDQAARIVLIDNRTADLATYDDELLLAQLVSLGTLQGTGFSADDLDDLLNDVRHDRPSKPATLTSIKCRINAISWAVDPETYYDWDTTIRTPNDIANLLKLPDNSWTTEEPT